MNALITHSCHVFPGHFGMFFFEGFGNPFCRFTHDFNLPDAGILKLNIVRKILLANP